MQGKDLTNGDQSDQTTPPDADGLPGVTPVAFEPRPEAETTRRGRARRLWLLALVLPAVLLLATAWFVFTARQLALEIDPAPIEITIQGGLPAPRFGTVYLIRPGKYRLHAVRPGYHDLDSELIIDTTKHQTLTFKMTKLPGRIDLTTHREDRPSEKVVGAVIRLGDEEIGQSPLEGAEIPAGRHTIVLQAPLYKTREATIEVEGEDRRQTFSFGLDPNWADVTFATDPADALVKIADRRLGRTPLTVPVEAGTHVVRFRREGYKPARTDIRVTAGQPLEVPLFRLEKIEGRLFVTSRPSGANVTVGQHFHGQTPLDITLTPDQEHVVRISEPGYQTAEHRVTIAPGARSSLAADLVPRRGRIRFNVSPPDARLIVNGQPYGKVPSSLDLIAVKHNIQIVKDGYRDFRTQVTPRPGYPLQLKVKLKRPYETDIPGVIQAPNGYRLKLIQPAAFQMGASRREQGRRANETLRQVRLTRPFYMGLKEVTNGQFRQFQAAHDAGIFKNYSLNRNTQPVVQVTWEQAAAFANWLSQREGLPRAYVRKGEGLVPVSPPNHGYRLPTEAEWAFCARVDAAGGVTKYPWGNDFPPPDKTVNLADKSAQTILDLYLENYTDGHPVAAPPGSLAPNRLGLFDLGGNVSEWCHDFYTIYTPAKGSVAKDPTGPSSGRHHVIRGGSWKQASIQTLRAAYRDYQEKKRLDLGFRLCRYVELTKETP